MQTTNEALVRLAADAFAACSVGGTISYQTLSAAIDQDILRNRWIIPRAQRLANAETGAIFRNVRHVGYERLPAEEAHGKGKSARRRGRRLFNSTMRQIEHALRHANDLTNDAVRRNWTELTHLGLLVHQTHDRNAPVVPPEATPANPSAIAAQSIDRMRAALGRQ